MEEVDGCYVNEKGERLSNCTFEVIQAVVVEEHDNNGGCLAIAKHKNGRSER